MLVLPKLIITSLHHLVVELSPYERRALRDVLNLETHQKDFISSLPLELVHIVLQYLDVSELFSLRRVCLIRAHVRKLSATQCLISPSGLEMLAAPTGVHRSM